MWGERDNSCALTKNIQLQGMTGPDVDEAIKYLQRWAGDDRVFKTVCDMTADECEAAIFGMIDVAVQIGARCCVAYDDFRHEYNRILEEMRDHVPKMIEHAKRCKIIIVKCFLDFDEDRVCACGPCSDVREKDTWRWLARKHPNVAIQWMMRQFGKNIDNIPEEETNGEEPGDFTEGDSEEDFLVAMMVWDPTGCTVMRAMTTARVIYYLLCRINAKSGVWDRVSTTTYNLRHADKKHKTQ